MTPAPLSIYVLWHPRSEAAEPLARAVYRWFHAPSDDLLRSGMGLPVYFRSQPADGDDGLPVGIDLHDADLNVIVVLADEHLVGDPSWAAWTGTLGSSPRALMVPVALHPSAYRLPETLRRLNFVRVERRGEAPLEGKALAERCVQRLLRQVTEVVGRELAVHLQLARGEGAARMSPPPLTVFLSHAKRDGVDIAEALRAAIQDHNRMRAFFDDTDLPVGHAFAQELNHAAGTDSAAMIAIVTDAYAARPWCRREVELARQPRPEEGFAQCWANRPLLVVDHLSGSPTRNIPELGNATVVRWNPSNALETVDLLMLEVVLGSYHRLRARQVPRRPGRHVISWSPDATSLLALHSLCGTEALAEVVYPGHALPEIERRALERLFPQLRLSTFEDAAAEYAASPRAAADRLVGLSIGFSPDLGALGLGREHVEEIALRVGRHVVESGGRIAFGGMLGSSGLTETLLTLARALSSDDDSDVSSRDPVARIISYQRWPSLPSVEQIAADVGIADYVLIGNPLTEDLLANDPRITSPQRSRQEAHALSAMRKAMTAGGRKASSGRIAPPLDARILVGGLRTDFNGFMPGLLEEALYSLEAGQPLFILGGFGGAAAILAQALLTDAWPAELQPDAYRKPGSRFERLCDGLAAHGEQDIVPDLFGRLRRSIERARADVPGGLNNGLDREQNLRLLRTDHVAEIVGLLRRGMSNLWERPAR